MANRPAVTFGLRADHRVVIRSEAGLFTVKVEPPLSGHDLNGTFPIWKQARGHAGGIRLVHRLPIQDLTSGEGLG